MEATLGYTPSQLGGGEFTGTDTPITIFFFQDPGSNPVRVPDPVPAPTGGVSYGSGSASTPFGQRVIVGYDARGYPIYQFIPTPVLRKFFDLNIGWNTRAYLPEIVGNAGIFNFKAGSTIGAIVGMTRVPDVVAGVDDIELGYLIDKGVAKILVKGDVVYAIPVGSLPVDAGKFNPETDHLEIRKFFGRVDFYITGASQGASEESLIASVSTTLQTAYFTAALYMGGDVINDERYWVPEYLSAKIGAKAYFKDDSFSDGYVRNAITLQSAFTEYEERSLQANITVAALFGDSSVGRLSANVGPVRFRATTTDNNEPVIEFGALVPMVGPVMSYFTGTDIDIGSLNASLTAKAFLTDIANYGRVRASVSARARFSELVDINEATFVSFGYGWHGFGGQSEYILLFSESLGVVGLFDADIIETGEFSSYANASSTLTYSEIIQALLSSLMSAGDTASFSAQDMSVWTLHMDAGGSTRYEGYNFNSFFTVDGVQYGANDTGIHRLEGSSDNGTAISSSVDFGKMGFGNNNRKSMPYVYVGMSSSGKTVLKVEAEVDSVVQTYYYTARDATEVMKTHRFELGRGLRANYYGMTLIAEGKDFDLHNIEFTPVELKRSL